MQINRAIERKGTINVDAVNKALSHKVRRSDSVIRLALTFGIPACYGCQCFSIEAIDYGRSQGDRTGCRAVRSYPSLAGFLSGDHVEAIL